MRGFKTYGTDDEARKASSRGLLRKGRWYPARIMEAVDKEDRHGKDMIELLNAVSDGQGGERLIKDWLTANEKGAGMLRGGRRARRL
jgi:hypothetical protein